MNIMRCLGVELQGFEDEHGRMQSRVEAARGEKHSLLASIVEAERKVSPLTRQYSFLTSAVARNMLPSTFIQSQGDTPPKTETLAALCDMRLCKIRRVR